MLIKEEFLKSRGGYPIKKQFAEVIFCKLRHIHFNWGKNPCPYSYTDGS